MTLLKRVLTLSLLTLVLLPAQAQTDLSSPVPVDPEVRSGTLQNGITYYIRHNREPENRASFYLIQNVGALLETDEQDGLAHFLEHMAFNGTQNFPGNTLISRLERHGVAFGRNINAYTAHNETVYNLSNIPVDRTGLLDTCLLIIHDWCDYLLLDEEEIDNERGVIIEEWRTRRNATFRLYNQYFPVLLKGSKYAERDVIGNIDVLHNFSYDAIRSFYHNWYRTDLQTIVAVGDFDPDEMEQKIIDRFSGIKPIENPQPRPFFEVPSHREPLYVLATDPEAPQNQINIYIKHRDIESSDKNLYYLKDQIVVTLMNNIIANRFQELLQRGEPPFIAGGIGFMGFVRGYDAFYMNASIKPGDGKHALQALYREAERIRRFGLTTTELERAKSNYLSAFENRYNQRDKISNDAHANAIQDYHLAGEPLASIEFKYEFIKEILPQISTRDLNQKYRTLMSSDNRVYIVMGEEKEGVDHLTEQEFNEIIALVENSSIEPYIDTAGSGELVSEELTGSVIVEEKNIDRFGATEWKLANGATVIYRKADYDKDNVSLSAFSFGGTSIYEEYLLPSASFLPMVIDAYGTGEFDAVDLQKALTGKRASLSISLGEVTEGFSGSSTPRDFETMLQLLYLKFENPRFDEEAHNTLMSRYSAFLSSMDNDPSKRMQDSLSMILTDYNPRTILLNSSLLEKVSFENIEKIYRDRFSNASEFTFVIVGNIEEEEVRPLVEKYIGSLTGSDRKESWQDRNIRPPSGITQRTIELPLTVPKATVFVSYSNEMEYNSTNNLILKVIQGILEMEYTEKVREDEGGTYGVSMNISSQLRPYENASGLIMFDCDPARADELRSIVHREIDLLVSRGPDREKFENVIQNLLKTRDEARKNNRYWSNSIYAWYLTGIDNNDPANYEELLNSLTPEKVQEIAEKFFASANRADVTFLPLNR